MKRHIWRGLLGVFLVAVLVAVASVGGAGTAEAGGNGLAKAIAAQEGHTDALMARAGVAGTAVGLGDDGSPVVVIFTETPGIGGLPSHVDGVRTSVRVSGRFVALAPPNKAPKVRIQAPANGATFASGELISFAGTASDREDGDLAADLVWTSDIDGEIGNDGDEPGGGAFDEVLSDGTHTITASVTDSGKAVGSASVTITVGTTPAPTPTPIPTPGPEPIDPTARFDRPVPIGVSTGHPDITAGTIGARVVDGVGNVYALSNNHVYADENDASIGDNVLQPGAYDGGVDPADAVGTLADYVPIRFDGTSNVVDAAIAVVTTDTVGNATPADGYGTPSATLFDADSTVEGIQVPIGLEVQKYGRTTGLTSGTVSETNVTVTVCYLVRGPFCRKAATFTGQIAVTDGSFSAGGDSGSLIVTDDAYANPVGLLFAGSDTRTLANPIDAVLAAFKVTIDGK
ncbi:MAG: hypothetical protein HQ548_09250 [Chloroflexi bacterium]|nr:hypothetical protein [Chloroflexota bacterium]